MNVTANRVPTAIQRTGSALTIIGAEEIARSNPASLTDVLRSAPGVSVVEAGGPGQTGAIFLRGANAAQTLVLLDGVRINDPSTPSGEFDIATIAPGLVERIEVLRGPQSALYGSDAIGGVVNIITRRGRGAPSVSLTTEAGSFGTVSTSASVSGATGPWSYAASGLGLKRDGFSAYGHRIGRITDQLGRLEADGLTRFGGFGRIGYDAGQGFRFDVGATVSDTRAEYDTAFGRFPDTPNLSKRRFGQVSAKAELDMLGGALTHTIQLFANRTERETYDSSFATLPGGRRGAESRSRTDFIGERIGAEYQAQLRLQQFGSLIVGARTERETADGFGRTLLPTPTTRLRSLSAEQTTNAGFALWQLPIGERLTVSLGGRYDKVSDVDAFATWRATAAYAISETGTKLRASAGTGGKAPSLFQRYSPSFGTESLSAERSFGYDVGIDQSFGDRLTLSATVFDNRIRNLIDFASDRRCRPDQVFGCYINIARANTAGLELGARAVLVEQWLSASGTYTYLQAKDALTNLTLARRPQHSGRFALQITPMAGLVIEPSVTVVGERFSSNGETDRLAPYARFDTAVSYAINQTFKVHARVENITDARYQDVRNYGATGRAVYVGLTTTW